MKQMHIDSTRCDRPFTSYQCEPSIFIYITDGTTMARITESVIINVSILKVKYNLKGKTTTKENNHYKQCVMFLTLSKLR